MVTPKNVGWTLAAIKAPTKFLDFFFFSPQCVISKRFLHLHRVISKIGNALMPIVTNYTAVHFQVLKSDTNFWCKLRKILQLSHFCGNKLFLCTTTFALIVQYPFLFSMPHLNVQPEKMLFSLRKSLSARLRKPFIRIEFCVLTLGVKRFLKWK